MWLSMTSCVLWTLLCLTEATKTPIIGILAQEILPDDPNKSLNYTSYLPAAYVKAVEASGARVVPVSIGRETQYYIDTVSKVNGFVFTGGSADIMSKDGVARSAHIVLKQVLKLNREGVRIPILGVCQGFELLAVLSNGLKQVLTDCQVENQALSLNLTPDYALSSLFDYASTDDLYTLTHLPSTSNHHGHCLTEKNMTVFGLKMWRVLSTSRSQDGFVFVSSMQWRSVPVAGVQFHPEKSPFEWSPSQANPHDGKSVRASRIFYDWVVAQSRLNNNSFSDRREETDSLIYNYSPIFTGKQGGYDEQNYYFKDPLTHLDNGL